MRRKGGPVELHVLVHGEAFGELGEEMGQARLQVGPDVVQADLRVSKGENTKE